MGESYLVFAVHKQTMTICSYDKDSDATMSYIFRLEHDN